MIELASLAVTAIAAATGYIGRKAGEAADAAVEAGGSKVLEWLKAKLTAPSDQDAIQKLEANPESEGARRRLEGTLLSRLEDDPKAAENLANLLKQVGATTTTMTQTVVGDKNRAAQVKGNENTIKIGR